MVRFPPTVLFIGCGHILLLLTFKWHDFLSLREDVYKWADVGRVAFCPAQLEGRFLLQSPQCPFPAQSQLFFPQGERFPLGREFVLGVSVILKGLDQPSFSGFPQPVSGVHVLFCLLICELESEKFVPSFTGCFSESFAEVLFSEESLWQGQGRAVFGDFWIPWLSGLSDPFFLHPHHTHYLSTAADSVSIQRNATLGVTPPTAV